MNVSVSCEIPKNTGQNKLDNILIRNCLGTSNTNLRTQFTMHEHSLRSLSPINDSVIDSPAMAGIPTNAFTGHRTTWFCGPHRLCYYPGPPRAW